MRLITIHPTLRGAVRAVVSDVMGDEIDELIDAVTVDAYGEDEQLWAFRQAFEDEGFFPFAGRVVGAEVQVESIDYAGEERRGLVANCRRDRQLHKVSLLDVTPSPPVHRQKLRLLDAYRRWSGVDPLPPLQLVSVPMWQYPGFAGIGIALPAARLALFPRGDGTERLDVLITRDAPAGVDLLSAWRLPAEDQVRADDVRALLAQATASTSPQLLVHGHWHHGYESNLNWIDRAATVRTGELTWDSTHVVGLGCDGDVERGWIVLELPVLDVIWPSTEE